MRAKKLISAAFVLVLIVATTPAIAQSPRGGNSYPYWSGYNTYPYPGAYPNRGGYNTYPYPGAYPNRGGYNSYPYSGAYPNTGGYNSYNAYPYNRGYNFPRKKRKNNWFNCSESYSSVRRLPLVPDEKNLRIHRRLQPGWVH